MSDLNFCGRTNLCLLLFSLHGVQAMKGGDADTEIFLDADLVFVQELWAEGLRSTL